jgi:hypothetical protein
LSRVFARMNTFHPSHCRPQPIGSRRRVTFRTG